MSEKSHSEQAKALAERLLAGVKEAVRKGNATKVLVKRQGETVVNLPVTAGAVAFIAAPFWAIVLSAITAIGLDCSVDVVKEDGQVVHIV